VTGVQTCALPIWLGMNLAFGNRIKKKDDKPMIGCEYVY
jgi:hypothetical protein